MRLFALLFAQDHLIGSLDLTAAPGIPECVLTPAPTLALHIEISGATSF